MNEVIESLRGEIYRAHQGDEQLRRDQQLLHEQLLEQNRDLREAHEKSLNEMEELKRFQGSTFDTISRRKLVEDRDTILELSCLCSELTLRRDDPASEAKGWIQGDMRIRLVLEVTTSFQHFKYGIEIRIWSVNQDNSQSWVRISYGTIKYVVDSIQDNTEIPADPHEEQASQSSVKVIAARSKAKAKPQPREPVGTTATIPIHERR